MTEAGLTAASGGATGGSERLHGYRRTPPLPERPGISAPDAPAEPPTRLGTDQPRLALRGLILIVPLFVLLAFGAGGPERSLQTLAPVTTFALPAIAMVAFYWEDWPGSSLRAGWAGLTDTLLLVAAAPVLSVAGQAVVAEVDLPALFGFEPGAGHVAMFPHTMPLAAGAFTVILQLTLVTEGWPLRGLGRVPSGIVALLVSWVIGAALYFTLLDVHGEPATTPGGLHELSGPVAPGAYGAWLTSVGAWQLVFFLALRGWPFSGIRRRAPRLLAGNVAVIACGWATYLILRHGLDWTPNRVFAVCGSVIAAILVVAMLFEAWPWTRLFSPLPGRLSVLITALVLTGVLYGVLSAVARHAQWSHENPDDWIGYAVLNALGMSVILHVAIWRRWPVATGTTGNRTA
ncbi:hypothetical protein [Streptosporangium sp. 'caverna']|uniref:hypothetical protein n=1 Tax=Streptosporangium sp. 'caverna' TaxID=2202249 RepID=UPI000D7D778B|nr:hypothetical protein [Streptosporangium sp. 'caverna']AWS42877.1 hypothetical protein DKM19_17420 [Streptosporangium sp. 'caverna']